MKRIVGKCNLGMWHYLLYKLSAKWLNQGVDAVFAMLQDVYVDGVQGTDTVDVDWSGLAVAADTADCLRHC